MNAKTTVVLIVLAAVVAAAFFGIRHFTGSAPPPPPPGTAETALLPGEPLDPAAVTRVVVRRGDEQFAFTREPGGPWVEQQPAVYPLRPSTEVRPTLPDLVVAGIASAEVKTRYAKGDPQRPSDAQAGIETPAAVIEFDGDRRLELLLGRHPTGGGYVQVKGSDDLAVIGNTVHAAIAKAQPMQWRLTTPDLPALPAAEAVAYTAGDTTARLTKRGGVWAMGPGGRERVDTDAAARLIEAARSLPVVGYEADEPTREALSTYGLDQPAMVLEVKPAAGGLRQLALGGTAEADTRYALLRGEGISAVVARVPARDAAALVGDPDALRDPRALPIGDEPVTRLRIQRRTAERGDLPPLHVRRDGDGYAFTSDDDATQPADGTPAFEPDTVLIGRLIDALRAATAEGYVEATDLTERELPIRATVEVSTAAGPPLGLQVYDDGEHLLTISGSEPVAYRVPAEALAGLFEPLTAYRDRTVYRLPLERTQRLVLSAPTGDITLVRRPEGEPAWSLADGGGVEADAVRELVAALSPLRCERWLSGVPRPSDGIELVADVEDGAQGLTLTVNPAGQATALAVPEAFELGADTMAALTAEFRDRNALPLSRDAVLSVTVDAGDEAAVGPVTVSRDTGGRYKSADLAAVDPAAAAALFEAVSPLRVQRYWAPADAEPLAGVTAAAEVEVLTRDGARHRVSLFAPPTNPLERWLARVGDDGRAAELSAQTAGRLLWPLSAAAQEAASGAATRPGELRIDGPLTGPWDVPTTQPSPGAVDAFK